MMNKIAIIGAGQLGSRHLQALNLVNQPLDILVIDPNLDALKVACSRFDALKGKTEHRVAYQQTMPPTLNDLDIAIVASTASTRRDIIERLLTHTQVKHLVLEKLLFTQREDYIKMAERFATIPTQVWVNCCMRMIPFYNQFDKLFYNTPINYCVDGSQYGLVTNAIHYLDHVVHLTGSSDFELNTTYLNPQIIPSKRPEFYELTGTLVAQFGNGSLAYLHCNQEGTSPIQIEIYNHEHRLISRENQHKAWVTSVHQDWVWQEQEAPIPYQSSLTADLVHALLTSQRCLLADYKTSMKVHLQLLDPLKAFLIAQGMNSEVDYPFT